MNVVSEDNDTIWFIAPIEATHQLCRISPSVGEVEVVTRGDHDINAFSMAGDRIVAEMCTISMATEFFGVDPADGTLTQLSAINKPVYDNIRMGEVQKRWVKTTDGKQMLTWVILPPDFDPAKKYPTLLFCEGGPQSPVSQFWSYRWNFQIMAANDYIIVAPNRRGLPGFGVEWNEAISGDYGGQCMKDYFTAIDEMAQEPFVDKDRLGCVGASFGGFYRILACRYTMTNASRHSSHTTVSSTWKCNIWKRKRNGLPTGIWAALIGKRTTLRHNALLPTPRISSSTNGTPLSSASTERRTSASLPTRQWPPSMQP